MHKSSFNNNIFYALKNIWKWDKIFYMYFILTIPLAILIPLSKAYLPKIVIDTIFQNKPIFSAIIIMVLYFIFIFFLDILNQFCNAKLNSRQYNYSIMYQNLITEKFMKTDFSNTDNPEAIRMYWSAMGDACSGQCAPEFIWRSISSLIINLLGIFTYGTIITQISPIILLLLFLSAVTTYFINIWIKNYNELNKDKINSIDRKISYLSSFSSKFDGAKDIRIYNMFDFINNLFSDLHKEKFIWEKRLSLRTFIGLSIDAILLLIRDSTAYFILVFMLFKNQIEISDFIFYFGIITGFSTWLRGIANNLSDISTKSTKISYYCDYFNMPEKYNHNKGEKIPKMEEIDICLELNNVSYQYKSSNILKKAIKNINLKIMKNEKVAIVGLNGAGKTTLVKLITGLYYPTEGTIKMGNIPTSEFNIQDYHSLFSVVFQDMYLLPVTIAEFISSYDTYINKEKVFDVIEKAGLSEKIKSLPNGIESKLMKGVFDDSIELSGGEIQKLMLARALYKDAPIIILDEPTASLDPIAEKELYLKYNYLTENKTSIYISHRLASTKFCDKIIVLEDGEIVEIGTHKELMKNNGKYANMFNLQSQYYKEEI